MKTEREHFGKINDIFSDPKKHVVSLREKSWRVELSFLNVRQFLYGNRFRHTSLLLFFIFMIAVVIGYASVSRADVAIFYPGSCLGGWQNSERAQGKPEVTGDSAVTFSEENSAVLKNTIAQIFCGQFDGNPPGSGMPKKVLLKFSWTIKPAADEAVATGTLPTGAEPAAWFWPFGTARAQTTDQATEVPLTETAPAVETPTGDAPNVQSDSESPASGASNPVPIDAAATSDVPIEDVSTDVATTSVSTTSAPDLTAPVFEQAGGVTTTPAADNTLFEVLYTLDGVTWQSLGEVGQNNWQNMVFELPLYSWDDMKKVQVSIKSLPTVDVATEVYLDGLWLEAEYEKLGLFTDGTATSTDEMATSSLQSATSSDDFLTYPAPYYSKKIAVGSKTDNNITVTISLDNISDIDGCDSSKCKYWQIHFEEKVGDYNRYYSSDAYPSDKLKVQYNFNLPAGTYVSVFLAGYGGSVGGYCGYIPEISSDLCPDGRHILSASWGLKTINSDLFASYPIVVYDTLLNDAASEPPIISKETALTPATTSVSASSVPPLGL